jgi:hypothetical protein
MITSAHALIRNDPNHGFDTGASPLILPTIFRYPSSSIEAMSPVRIQHADSTMVVSCEHAREGVLAKLTSVLVSDCGLVRLGLVVPITQLYWVCSLMSPPELIGYQASTTHSRRRAARPAR